MQRSALLSRSALVLAVVMVVLVLAVVVRFTTMPLRVRLVQLELHRVLMRLLLLVLLLLLIQLLLVVVGGGPGGQSGDARQAGRRFVPGALRNRLPHRTHTSLRGHSRLCAGNNSLRRDARSAARTPP